MKTYIYLLFFLLPLNFSFAGTIDPGVSDQRYIEYGKKFQYIGKLCGSYEDTTLFCASAVVIKANYILTAAHVVKGYKTCSINIEGKDYDVESIILPSKYDPNIFGMNDIAIGFVRKPIELDFYPDLYDQNDEIGKVCCISGYGLTGNFFTGAIKSDLKRRAGSNIVEEIQKELLVCKPSKFEDHTRTSLEFLIASGDSGGGLFIDGKLAGINSCVSGIGKNIHSTYETESGHTRISIHREWILRNIRENNRQP